MVEEADQDVGSAEGSFWWEKVAWALSMVLGCVGWALFSCQKCQFDMIQSYLLFFQYLSFSSHLLYSQHATKYSSQYLDQLQLAI